MFRTEARSGVSDDIVVARDGAMRKRRIDHKKSKR
jgi:hypothetical protein